MEKRSQLQNLITSGRQGSGAGPSFNSALYGSPRRANNLDFLKNKNQYGAPPPHPLGSHNASQVEDLMGMVDPNARESRPLKIDNLLNPGRNQVTTQVATSRSVTGQSTLQSLGIGSRGAASGIGNFNRNPPKMGSYGGP